MEGLHDQLDPVTTRRRWFKSTASNGACSCVEVKFELDRVKIRDSKFLRDPANEPSLQPIISVSPADWATFVTGVGGAHYTDSGTLTATPEAEGSVRLESVDSAVVLTYTPAEWDAFVAGVHAGEFDPPRTLVDA